MSFKFLYISSGVGFHFSLQITVKLRNAKFSAVFMSLSEMFRLLDLYLFIIEDNLMFIYNLSYPR